MANSPKLARNREMFELRCEGWKLSALADKYGVTVQAISLALKDYREKHVPAQAKEDMRAMIDEIYRENIAALYAIAKAGAIPAYSNGRPIVTGTDDAGNDVYADDWSGAMKARDQIVKVTEAMRKMWGLDDATKIESSGEIRHTIVGIPIEDL